MDAARPSRGGLRGPDRHLPRRASRACAPACTLEQARGRARRHRGRARARSIPKENRDAAARWCSGCATRCRERSRLLVIALCGAALCILLLACANLASLFLARGAAPRARARRARPRSAPGASAWCGSWSPRASPSRVVGGVVGVAVAAAAACRCSRGSCRTSLPIAEQPSVDLRVLALRARVLVRITGLALRRRCRRIARGAEPRCSTRCATACRAGGGRTQRLRAALVDRRGRRLGRAAGLVGAADPRDAGAIQAIDPASGAEDVLDAAHRAADCRSTP